MSPAKSILPLALGGLVIGLMLGAIAAGAYASWVTGRDVANVGFTTIFDFLPATLGGITTLEPIRTALMIWGGLGIALAIAIPAFGTKRQLTSHGSARWATKAEMKRSRLLTPLKTLNGPIYGKVGTPKSRADFLSSRDIPHSITSAPTGSGKTRSVVIPTILVYPGSILVLDLKGELFAKTSRRRVSFGDAVYKFSPYAEDGRTHRYNPLQDVADTHERRRFTEARRLAASFIIAHGNGQGFLEGARDIFAATAMLAVERKTPTIGAVFDALSQPGDAFATLRKLGDEVKSPEAKKIFYKMGGMEARILSSYLSVLSDGGLSLWADPAVRAATSASDFSIKTLRSEPASIYLVVSPNDLVPLAPLIRLMFQQTISIMQRAEPDLEKGEKYTVLFCLDEFPALGKMDVLVSAIATLRSYGGRIMIVVQTISSLDVYGKEGAAVILANCRMQLFMAPADKDTPAYISSAIGDFTRKSRSKSWKGGDLSTSYQEREDGAPLIRPEQLRMLGDDLIVALVQNSNPILVRKVLYDQDRVLKPLFEGQTGPYPEPPELPDEPLAIPQEPVVPKPTQGGAAVNPIADHRPVEEEPAAVAAPVEAKVEPETQDTAETPTVEDDADLAAEPADEQHVYSVRNQWRHMSEALIVAQKLYRPDPDQDDTGQTDNASGNSEVTPTQSEADAKENANFVNKPSLKKTNLAEAQASHARNKGNSEDSFDA
ncbi:type IV secretion system ATPase VirD4 [uncultured Jannaschia sp.]|uniref:type IV secretion system ATPase VirD4 n=1 Tax=uncultured Jannaschia sp. TaxID=293347 RepID=UPI00260CC410|nr:type IV secretion system ATPase VirD4 [uncultured Jannaschia sp.]